ncbi:MAG TPA: hypothetical protein PLX23_07525 [Candidatus Hydrogenedens sp.]|nr:hypothetical protein [Candidatus Hydrogenedens sp.]
MKNNEDNSLELDGDGVGDKYIKMEVSVRADTRSNKNFSIKL